MQLGSSSKLANNCVKIRKKNENLLKIIEIVICMGYLFKQNANQFKWFTKNNITLSSSYLYF